MKINVSAGRLPKNIDCRDRSQKLELKACQNEPFAQVLEEELLARIYYQVIRGAGEFLEMLREKQAKDKKAPQNQGEIPKK